MPKPMPMSNPQRDHPVVFSAPPCPGADPAATACPCLGPGAATDFDPCLQLALWASGEGVWRWASEDGALRIDGLEFNGRPTTLPPLQIDALLECMHPDDRQAAQLGWRMHLSGAQPNCELVFRLRLQEDERWVRLYGRALTRGVDGRATRVIGTARDISSSREAEESLRVMASAFAQAHDPLVITDDTWKVLEANDAYAGLVGQPAEWLVGSSLLAALPVFDAMLANLSGDRHWQGECEICIGVGQWVPVGVSISAVLGEDLSRRFHIVALRDLRSVRAQEARERALQSTDRLTGLPNRSSLEARLGEVLGRGETMALMFLDVAGMKEVNDSYGHKAGDGLMRSLCVRLQQVCDRVGAALLARWSGTEFAVMLGADSAETEVRAASQAVLAALSEPFQIDAQEVVLTVSIGAALAPHDGRQCSELLRKVDVATRSAKERGHNQLAFFVAGQELDAQRRVRMFTQLRLDAERNGFSFVAQPKVDRNGCAVGAELLMRWPTEAFGMVSPVEFIPMAEKLGLIGLMGRHALHAAARLAARCQATGQRLPVAVNLSPKQVLQRGLDRQVMLACERAGIEPGLIELELTESALSVGLELVAPVLHNLRKRGFGLALDDFGTGYSSLSYLRHLPFSKIKIDRSFVMDLGREARTDTLLQHMVGLVHALGMTVVAEGVETVQQFELLRELGIEEFQGYHFARPMPLEQWEHCVESHGAGQILLPQGS